MTQAARKQKETQTINGIDVGALSGAIEEVGKNPAKGLTRWKVTTSWKGGTHAQTQVDGYEIGGQFVKKNFTIHTDEPFELCGNNQYPNPQETLLAALNSCMTVGYAALCSLEGIELEELRIETKGDIDLRGFFGLDDGISPGYDGLDYTVHIKGNGTPEQFRKIHEAVQKTSPNYFNLSRPVPLNAELVVE